MGWKRILGYLIYTIVLLLVYFLIVDTGTLLQEETGADGGPGLYVPLLYVIIGILLGLPILVRQFRSDGNWTISGAMIVFMGLPMLYFACYPLLAVHGPGFLTLASGSLNELLMSGRMQLPGIAVGFILMTCVYKEKTSGFGGRW
ncbi:hypothetical protein [Alkalicoccus urumqiensis]|uniref:Uncharacterized protein n=1 Tax=Alkalicoccus urumqiensis TaxID=1548213 RepID=A0A2P6MM22_ALKUR|nr:hypothetical protein [Alkalicoccus urumqiensis]PRO67300.1 hypothetical protein C6I21_01715 [Alkalicoccus urumqiensis]